MVSLNQYLEVEAPSARFKFSYGGWMTISELLSQNDFVKFQRLSKYMYKTGVPRIQTKFTLPGIDHFMLINVAYAGEWKAPLVHYNSRTRKSSWMIHPFLKFEAECKTF